MGSISSVGIWGGGGALLQVCRIIIRHQNETYRCTKEHMGMRLSFTSRHLADVVSMRLMD